MQQVEAFHKAEDEYQRLRAQHEAGRLTDEQFTAALQALRVEYEGRYWMLGANSGSWYVYDGQAWIPQESPGSGSPRPVAVKPTYDVILQKVGVRKISVVKLLREMSGDTLSLRAAKDLADHAPSTINRALARAEAESVQKRLEAVGATVDICPTVTAHE